METLIAFNKSGNPKHTGIYIVDRGEKLGTPYRYYNAETDAWSRCEYTIEDAIRAIDTATGLGFLPWRGPVKVNPKALAPAPVELVKTVDEPAVVKVTKAPKVAKAPKAAKPKTAKVKVAKAVHADGTIVFREDRNKYMAWYGGKAEAARPTVEAAQAFLTKKYGVTEFIVIGPTF